MTRHAVTNTLGALAVVWLVATTTAMTIGTDQSVTFVGKVSNTKIDTTLAAAVTTLAVTNNFVNLTGDGGGNTLATITGGVSGMKLTLLFVDALVTITDTDAAIAAGTPGGVIIGPSNAFTGTQILRLTVANVTGCNAGVNGFTVAVNNTSGHACACNSVAIKNILTIDGRDIDTTGMTGIAVANNLTLTNAEAPGELTSYVQFGGLDNNLSPQSGATDIIGQGANLTAFFDTDIVNRIRPTPTTAWSIGVYEGPWTGDALTLSVTTHSGNWTALVSRAQPPEGKPKWKTKQRKPPKSPLCGLTKVRAGDPVKLVRKGKGNHSALDSAATRDSRLAVSRAHGYGVFDPQIGR